MFKVYLKVIEHTFIQGIIISCPNLKRIYILQRKDLINKNIRQSQKEQRFFFIHFNTENESLFSSCDKIHKKIFS